MFLTKRKYIGIYALITLHTVNSFVLLTANIEDIKKIARKFVSDDMAESITNMILKLGKSAEPINVSAENDQNADKLSKEEVLTGQTATNSQIPTSLIERSKLKTSYKTTTENVDMVYDDNGNPDRDDKIKTMITKPRVSNKVTNRVSTTPSPTTQESTTLLQIKKEDPEPDVVRENEPHIDQPRPLLHKEQSRLKSHVSEYKQAKAQQNTYNNKRIDLEYVDSKEKQRYNDQVYNQFRKPKGPYQQVAKVQPVGPERGRNTDYMSHKQRMRPRVSEKYVPHNSERGRPVHDHSDSQQYLHEESEHDSRQNTRPGQGNHPRPQFRDQPRPEIRQKARPDVQQNVHPERQEVRNDLHTPLQKTRLDHQEFRNQPRQEIQQKGRLEAKQNVRPNRPEFGDKLRSGDQQNTRPGDKQNARPGDQQNARPGDQQNARPGDQQNARPAHEEYREDQRSDLQNARPNRLKPREQPRPDNRPSQKQYSINAVDHYGSYYKTKQRPKPRFKFVAADDEFISASKSALANTSTVATSALSTSKPAPITKELPQSSERVNTVFETNPTKAIRENEIVTEAINRNEVTSIYMEGKNRLTTASEKVEFDMYENPNYHKPKVVATSGPVHLSKVEEQPWWEQELPQELLQ